MQGKEMLICTDSEVSIKALKSHETTSRMVKKCKETLNLIGLRNWLGIADKHNRVLLSQGIEHSFTL